MPQQIPLRIAEVRVLLEVGKGRIGIVVHRLASGVHAGGDGGDRHHAR